MPWQTLGEFELSRDWVLSTPVEAEIFRITHKTINNDSDTSFRGVVAQGFIDGQINIFNPKIFIFRPETEIFIFNFPFGIEQHSLCFKHLSSTNINWIIEAEFFTSDNQSENFANYLISRFGEIPDMSNIYSRENEANLKPISGEKNLDEGVVGTLIDKNENRCFLTVRTGIEAVQLFAEKDENGNPKNLIEELAPGEVFDLPVAGGIYKGVVFALAESKTTISFTEYSK